MRTIQLSFLLLLAALSLHAQQREQRSTDPFNAVVFEGRGELILTPAKEPALEVEAKEGVDLTKLKTYVKGRTLHISYDRDDSDIFDLYPKVTVYLYYNDLDKLTCQGIVDARTTEPIVSGTFHFTAEGVGSNRLHVNADRLTVELAGTVNLNLEGTAYREVILMDGTGTLDAFALEAQEVAAEINGTGSVFLNASESLFVDANGFGAEVKYKGNPKKKNINKSGWVKIQEMARK